MGLDLQTLILEQVPVLVLSPKKQIENWNKSLSQIYGWLQPEALGKDAHQLLKTVFPQPLDELEQRFLENGQWEGELIQTKKDGTQIIVSSHWLLQTNEKGQILAILEFINDISESKKIEHALRESEYKYKNLIIDSPLAIFQSTVDGKAIMFNPAFARLFGYQSPEECLELVHNADEFYEDPKRRAEIIKIIQKHPDMTRFENLYRRKDGSTFWGNLNVRRIENREGLPPCFEGFIEDVTERKHAEESALKRNQMLLALHNITLEMGTELQLPVLLKNILEHVQSLLNADRGGGIYLYDSSENVIRLAYGSGINQARDGITVQMDQGVAGHVFRTSQPLVIDDYTHWEEHAIVLVPDPPSTVMGVPLLLNGQVIGALLLIANSGLRKFIEQDVRQAEMFAAQAAVVIRNAQLYQHAQQEIIEHQRAEEKLREAERFNQATIDALPTQICVLDENGTIISVNRAWRIFADENGVTDPHYYIGMNYLTVCDSAQGKDSEGASSFADGIRRVMRHEIGMYSLEYTCDSPWENRWFIANVSRFNDEWGHLVVIHVNITDRKQSELRLSQLTKRYQDLFENSGTNIIAVDENGKYIMANKSAAQNFGVTPEELIGKTIFDFLSSGNAHKYLEFNRQLLETGGHREYEDTYSLPVGERTFLIVDQCIQDENKKNFAIQSSSIDITERKRAEQGLRESRERLSHLSYRLVESQEQERRRIARELHDEIGQTLTALTISLNGISQNALDSVLNNKIENLKGLARDLIAQVNALSSELRPRVLEDLGLIPGLLSLINRLSFQTGIEIDFKHGLLPQKQIPPEIEITAYRIIQEALTNVVRHAKVKLAIVRIQIDENSLWIQIQDEGQGFDYPTVTSSPNSMGLLSMQERAEQVGGLFMVQSVPGEGTNITCLLPMREGYIERRKHARD